MNVDKEYISILHQLIHIVEKGLLLLDESSQEEIRTFVSDQQHSSGAFLDRSNNPDVYYSLFGFILVSALNMQENQNALQGFVVSESVDREQNIVNKLALTLISEELLPKKKKVSLLRLTLYNKYRSSIVYRVFLYFLILDSRYGKNQWLSFFARLIVSCIKIPSDSPSSIVAALIVARQMLGLKTRAQSQKLISYSIDEGGFKSFDHMNSSDMLSTGVSLFALKKIGYDLRPITPACLDFIQSNFNRGAFLSGDGDKTSDLEYTFYGLLALGCLS